MIPQTQVFRSDETDRCIQTVVADRVAIRSSQMMSFGFRGVQRQRERRQPGMKSQTRWIHITTTFGEFCHDQRSVKVDTLAMKG